MEWLAFVGKCLFSVLLPLMWYVVLPVLGAITLFQWLIG